MSPSPKSSDFEIHVDGSCLTPSDLEKPQAQADEIKGELINEGLDRSADEPLAAPKKGEAEARKEFGDEKTEALIRAAAQDILAKMELERAGYDVESILSARTDEDAESYIEKDPSEVSREGEEGTEISYTEGEGTELSQDDHTEKSYDDGSEMTSGESTEVSYDNGSEMTYREETEFSYDGTEGTEGANENRTKRADDSEHDADVSESESGRTQRENDEVFSQGDERSGSSRNSINSQNEILDEKDAASADSESEIFSGLGSKEDVLKKVHVSPGSEISSMPPFEDPIQTPTKQSLHMRPPFRTPSSVRAIQMSSPTPSVINGSGSPHAVRSKSRTSVQTPVSRTATPSSNKSKLRKKLEPTTTPAKDVYPLVLLHATLLPLHFPYSSLLDSGEPLPESVQRIRETWRLLQEKLGDVILDRGVLLPHPKEDFKRLEEVLLEALELPLRKHAEILTCGHYLRPSSDDLDSIMDTSESDLYNEGSDAESTYSLANVTTRRHGKNHMCPTCDKPAKIDESKKNVAKQRRFRVKVYASNGLMGAGAWMTAWKEMERVDVEIEPYVKEDMVSELDDLQMLYNKHLEELERREEETRQREYEQQQQKYEQEYEQQQEREVAIHLEQQQQPEVRGLEEETPEEPVDVEPQIPEPEISIPVTQHLEGENYETTHETNHETIHEQTSELPHDTGVPVQESIQNDGDDQLLRESDSAQRLREVYGNGPEALERIQSAQASVANSRPQSRSIHDGQPPFSQSSPIPPHALAARLHGLHSPSPSRSPERFRPGMASSSPSHSSGYGRVARNELPSYLGEYDYAYGGNRPYSQEFTQNRYEEKQEEFMRERLRRRTEKGNLPPRFGEGIEVPQSTQPDVDRESSTERKKPNIPVDSDSFLELLVAAFKVAMRDRKNVVILVLGVLVLFFALKPANTPALSQPLTYNGNIENSPVMATSAPQRYEQRNEQRRQADSDDYGYEYEEEVEVESVAPRRISPREDTSKIKPKSFTGTSKPKAGKNSAVKKQPTNFKIQVAKTEKSPREPKCVVPADVEARVDAEVDVSVDNDNVQVDTEVEPDFEDEETFEPDGEEEVRNNEVPRINPAKVEEFTSTIDEDLSSTTHIDETNTTHLEGDEEEEAEQVMELESEVEFDSELPNRHSNEDDVEVEVMVHA